jgi:hypothetical protein
MKTKKPKKWCHTVKTRNAIKIPPGTFRDGDPKAIALAVKQAAESGSTTPYPSAMSYLCFYINRGGKNLPPKHRRTVERAKTELRLLFGR